MTFSRSSVSVLSGALPFLLLAASCKKNNNASSGGSLSATAGTSAFSAASSQDQLQAVFNTALGYFDIAGLVVRSSDTAALEITVPAGSKLGMPVSSDTTLVTINYSPHYPSSVYEAGLGFGGHAIATLTIQDTVHHKVAGTFSGVVYNQTGGTDSIVITNGQFNTSYVVQ